MYSRSGFVAVLTGATSFEVFADLMVDAKNGEFTWASVLGRGVGSG